MSLTPKQREARRVKSPTTNENASICSPCGGRCCRIAPGLAIPSDFKKPLKESIAAAIKTGRWCLDYGEADERLPETYFVRPAVMGKEGQAVHPSWGGECTFLGDEGCSLAFFERPFTCRDLVPAPGEFNRFSELNCFSESGNGSKVKGVSEWVPFQDVLKEIRP